jgi:5'-nucleotidase
VLQNGSNKSDTGFIDSDVTAEYIRGHSPVNPAVEGRITEGTAAPAGAPANTSPNQPAQLPNTGGDLTPLWLLAALGASAIGSGVRLRNRARRAPAPEVLAEIEEDVQGVG